MTSRRVKRIESETVDVAPSYLRNIWNMFLRFLRPVFHALGGVIRGFWYILERVLLIVVLIGLTVFLAWWLSQKPSLYRDWSPDQAILPTVSFSGTMVTIENARAFRYTSPTEYSSSYYTEQYNLDEIEKMYYIIEPFSEKDGPAHTMVSFSFSGGKNVVISPEIRKERGETFDAIRGFMNQYELAYMIGDEEDMIKLRTNYRKDQVYMYPVRATKSEIALFFRSLLIRSDKLAREPEFYNTLWNACSTSLLNHANALRNNKLSWNLNVLLPSHSDEMIYNVGLIDTKLPLDQARSYYRVDELARSVSGEVNFSSLLRKEQK